MPPPSDLFTDAVRLSLKPWPNPTSTSAFARGITDAATISATKASRAATWCGCLPLDRSSRGAGTMDSSSVLTLNVFRGRAAVTANGTAGEEGDEGAAAAAWVVDKAEEEEEPSWAARACAAGEVPRAAALEGRGSTTCATPAVSSMATTTPGASACPPSPPPPLSPPTPPPTVTNDPGRGVSALSCPPSTHNAARPHKSASPSACGARTAQLLLAKEEEEGEGEGPPPSTQQSSPPPQ
mmetsp:Transcript_44395/g.89669  ORF Transcript_44395/g.89669 Transcript_44395/m.89669 type:complete len:239 (+) Transcript_44395:193-909(+)